MARSRQPKARAEGAASRPEPAARSAPRAGAAQAPTPARAASAPARADHSHVSAAAADRAAHVLWIGLIVLAALRAALAFTPGMWAWSLNLQRFLAPAWAWLPWLAMAAVLLPAVGRPSSAALARAGDAMARGPQLAMPVAAALGALLVWVLPDQVRFVGDFLIRQGTVEEVILPGKVWPQALPLDAWLHFTVPLWLSNHGWTDANGAARLLGAAEGAALAALAVAFARTLGLRGAAAITAACVVFFGGTLGLFTGYSKAFVELAVLSAAIGVSALRAVRDGKGLLAMGVAFAIAITLHRSALGYVPAVLLTWVLCWRAHHGASAWRSPGVIAAALVPLAALLAMLPRIVRIVRDIDPVHFATPEIAQHGGLLAAALAGARPADALNLVLLLSPLAAVAIPVALAWGRALPKPREPLVLAVLCVPFIAMIPFVHALGGLFRDYDDFAAGGVALSLLVAWLIARTLERAQRLAWLAAAAALAVMVPSVQWLALHSDAARGLARIEALMREPPARTGAERGRTFDYLGTRWYQLEQYEPAAEAFKAGCVDAPSPRMLQQWAMAETMRGNMRAAADAYRQQLAKEPGSVSGWMGLAAVTSRIPDYFESRRALGEVLKLKPGDAEAQQLLLFLDQDEARWKAAGSPPVSPLP